MRGGEGRGGEERGEVERGGRREESVNLCLCGSCVHVCMCVRREVYTDTYTEVLYVWCVVMGSC